MAKLNFLKMHFVSLQRSTILFCCIILIAFFLRIFKLAGSSFWLDESASIYYADMNLNQMIQSMLRSENHPPLYYFILHLWKHLGEGEFMLRLLSVIVGTACVYAMYILSRKLSGDKFALLSSFLLAISFPNIFSSQEARMYIFLCAFTIFTAYYLYMWIEEKEIIYLVLYSLISLLNLYTHLFALFILFASNVYFFSVIRKEKKRITRWVLAHIFIMLLYFPWLIAFLKTHLFFKTYSSYVEIKSRIGIDAVLYYFFQLFTGGRFHIDFNFLFISLALLSTLLFLSGIKRIQTKKSLLVLLFFLVPFACAVALTFIFSLDLFKVRYLNFLIPFYLIFICAAVYSIKNKTLKTILILSFIIFNFISCFNFYYNPFYQRQDWRGAAEVIKKYSIPGDLVIVRPFYAKAAMDYYLHGRCPVIGIDKFNQISSKKDLKIFKRMWFVEVPAYYRPEEARDFLGKDWQLVACDYTKNYFKVNILAVYIFRLKNF